MPGSVKVARVISFVQGGLWAIVTLRSAVQLITGVTATRDIWYSSGYVFAAIVTAILFGALAAFSIILPARFAPGRRRERIGLIVVESLQLLLSVVLIVVGFVVISTQSGNDVLAGVILIGATLLISFLPEWVLVSLTRPAAKEYFSASPG
jgi:hypothetical protein